MNSAKLGLTSPSFLSAPSLNSFFVEKRGRRNPKSTRRNGKKEGEEIKAESSQSSIAPSLCRRIGGHA